MAMPKIIRGRTCKHCSKPLPEYYRANRIYCSDGCRRQFEIKGYGLTNGNNGWAQGISTSTVGAIHQMIVAIDLLKKKLMVFQAVSPSCDCDLAVVQNGKLLRVEVTTAYRKKNGGVIFAKHDSKNYDVLALVFHDSSIEYRPPLS